MDVRSAAKFPPDYYIVTLRGAKRLTPARRRRALEERAAWLEDKIRDVGPKKDLYVKELAAIAQSLEDLEGAEV